MNTIFSVCSYLIILSSFLVEICLLRASLIFTFRSIISEKELIELSITVSFTYQTHVTRFKGWGYYLLNTRLTLFTNIANSRTLYYLFLPEFVVGNSSEFFWMELIFVFCQVVDHGSRELMSVGKS